MDGDEKPMSSQRREQVLENCRWLFGQEVQLITFYHTFNNGVSNACTALILPKSYSLHSQPQTDFNSKILFKAECKAKGKKWVTREDAINNLLWAVESKVGEILQPDEKGTFQINTSAIPEGYKLKKKKMIKNETDIPTGKPKVENETEIPTEPLKKPATPVENIGEPIYELDSRSIRGKEVYKPVVNKKIWRIVGYTPSGDPCIEEHEPKGSTDTKNTLSPPRYVVLGAPKTRPVTTEYAPSSTETDTTIFTPDTPVMSDTKTATSFDEDNRRVNNVLALAARAGAKFAELQSKCASGGGNLQASSTPIRSYQQILDEQDLAVNDLLHWIRQKDQRIISLETELREAQISRDARTRMCNEMSVQLEKETLRANESEAREMDTNALLERLFKNRTDTTRGLEM